MLDKTILVFYINVGDVSASDGHEYIKKIREGTALNSEDESQLVRYFIPIRKGDTRIECLNPPVIFYNKKILKKENEKLLNIEKRLDKVDSIMFPLTRAILTEKNEE